MSSPALFVVICVCECHRGSEYLHSKPASAKFMRYIQDTITQESVCRSFLVSLENHRHTAYFKLPDESSRCSGPPSPTRNKAKFHLNISLLCMLVGLKVFFVCL